MLVVLMAKVDELLLQGVLELLEGLDGLVLGGVRGREFDGLSGSLHVCACIGELLTLVHGVWELSSRLACDMSEGHTMLN